MQGSTPTFYFHKSKVIGLNYNYTISVIFTSDWYNLTNYCQNNRSWLWLKLQQMVFYGRWTRKQWLFFLLSLSEALWLIINIGWGSGHIESFLYFPRSSYLVGIEGNPPERDKWVCLEKHHFDWLIGRMVEENPTGNGLEPMTFRVNAFLRQSKHSF
jgi:hypothetical protein